MNNVSIFWNALRFTKETWDSLYILCFYLNVHMIISSSRTYLLTMFIWFRFIISLARYVAVAVHRAASDCELGQTLCKIFDVVRRPTFFYGQWQTMRIMIIKAGEEKDFNSLHPSWHYLNSTFPMLTREIIVGKEIKNVQIWNGNRKINRFKILTKYIICSTCKSLSVNEFLIQDK